MKLQIWPSNATRPSAAPIAKKPMISGVTPAINEPNTTSSTTIATMMPMLSPLRRSSSEIFLKSSVDVGCPSEYIVVVPVEYLSRTASSWSTYCAV